MLKKIGSLSRAEIEGLFGTKVFLELWVKVKPDWRNNEFMLRLWDIRNRCMKLLCKTAFMLLHKCGSRMKTMMINFQVYK